MRSSWPVFIGGVVLGAILSILLQPVAAMSLSQELFAKVRVQVWEGNRPLHGPVTIAAVSINDQGFGSEPRPILHGVAGSKGEFTSTVRVPLGVIPEPVRSGIISWMKLNKYQNPGL